MEKILLLQVELEFRPVLGLKVQCIRATRIGAKQGKFLSVFFVGDITTVKRYREECNIFTLGASLIIHRVFAGGTEL